MHLRDGGIYCLPNGRELVAASNGENGHVSYKLFCTTCTDSSDYEVSDEGRLLCSGRLTAWDINDLSDTGKTHY
ncbi:MAG TPA: hypothetical protein VFD62_09775 [Pyrinomonadaceae bacterium]|nr:hypothetical protein [Pyrinomonadaceae bacterium]